MADARRWLSVSLGTGFVLGMAQACLIADPNHCLNAKEGDDPCPGTDVCDPCTSSETNKGCVPPLQARCVETDGSSSTNGPTENGPDTVSTTMEPVTTTDDTDSTTVTPGDTETSTSTGPQPSCTVVPGGGTYDETCPPDAPFCIDGTCTRCDDLDPNTTCANAEGAPGRICSSEGACVECTPEDVSDCTVDAPVCDPETNECRACVAHDECPNDAACHLFEGTCLPGDQVLMVQAPPAACGMKGQPFCNISTALTAAGVGADVTLLVSAGIYVDNVVITSDAVVAIIASGDVSILGTGGSPAITVNNAGTVYLDGVTVENTSVAPGIQSAGDLWVEGSRIQDADVGISSTAGEVYLANVRVLNNTQTGVSVGGTEPVELRNVIIAGNGSGTSPRGFVTTGSTPFSMVYTTIADNAGSSGGAINSPSGTGVVRNSILVSNNLAASVGPGGTIDITNSVVADDDFAGVGDNIGVASLDDLMFDAFFEIQTGSIADGVAVWMTGDPLFDINGVMRPGADGMPDAAGANVPQ